MPWTTQEISLLIGCWPTASAAQISRRLNRSRASICGKAMRLRRGNLLPAGVQKHFEVKPAQTRPGCTTTTVTSIMPTKPTPAVDAPVPPSEMRRCSLLETRQRPMPLAAWRSTPGRGAVLRRHRGAGISVLRAPLAAGAIRQGPAANRVVAAGALPVGWVSGIKS